MLNSQPFAQITRAQILKEHQLVLEIVWFEIRLCEIGDGENAYEKGLARAYEEALSDHRVRLADLQRLGKATALAC